MNRLSAAIFESKKQKDIEQAVIEEGKKIIAQFDNDFALAPNDDSYLRLLVKDTLETLRTGKIRAVRADESLEPVEEVTQRPKRN